MAPLPARSSQGTVSNYVDPSDREHPRSLYSLVPKAMQQAIDEVPSSLLELSIDELEQKTLMHQFSNQENQLRHAFWAEYHRAQESGRKMDLANVYGGTMTRQAFFIRVVNDRVKLAYLLTPPSNYVAAMHVIMEEAMKRDLEIVKAKPFDDDGKPNVPLMALQHRVKKDTEDRLHGTVIQRVAQENLNLHVAIPGGQPKPESLEDIDRRIRELERELPEQVGHIATEGHTLADEEDAP